MELGGMPRDINEGQGISRNIKECQGNPGPATPAHIALPRSSTFWNHPAEDETGNPPWARAWQTLFTEGL